MNVLSTRRYVNIKPIDDAVCHDGYVKVPKDTEFDVDNNGFIYTVIDGKKKRICWETSSYAYSNFAFNTDGQGYKRKQLINECKSIMSKIVDKDVKFAVFFDDDIAIKYKKHPEDNTEWSWDYYKIHTAPISDLEHIKMLVEKM